MNISKLRTYLVSKEAKYPQAVGLLRKTARLLPRRPVPTSPMPMRKELSAVAEVLKSPNWNMNYGKNLVHEKLEEEFAAYVGTNYAIAVNTGGMAIQMALRGLGIKPGDEVVHQVDTCVANAFAIIAAGGTPIFSDINDETFMLSCSDVVAQISAQTKVLMPVHIWGNVEDLDWVGKLSKERGLYVIEDACLALGAEWKGKRVGSFGNAGVFSLGCLKPIQAGEGGIIVTNDESLASELRTIRNWGDMTAEFGVRDQQTLSWNGRISEFVAAIALEQLRGYPKYFERLREQVAKFVSYLANVDGIEMAVSETEDRKPAYSQIVVRLGEGLGISKDELMKRLRDRGIGAWHANFEPINTLSFFKKGAWRDWILRGNLDRVENNYNRKFVSSEKAFLDLGMGFPKDYFLSSNGVKSLMTAMDQALARKHK